MGRACTVCGHRSRPEIDGLLVTGSPHRRVAEDFGLSSAAVHRHARSHLPQALTAAAAAQGLALGGSLLDQVAKIRDATWEILQEARARGAHRDAIAAARECRAAIEVLARASGELTERHAHLHAVVPSARLEQKLGELADQIRAQGPLVDPEQLRTAVLAGEAALPSALARVRRERALE